MSVILSSLEDRIALGDVLKEFDPATHELTRGFADTLPSEDWGAVQDCFRLELKAELETWLMVRALNKEVVTQGYTGGTDKATLRDTSGNFLDGMSGERHDRWERFGKVTETHSEQSDALHDAYFALVRGAMDRLDDLT